MTHKQLLHLNYKKVSHRRKKVMEHQKKMRDTILSTMMNRENISGVMKALTGSFTIRKIKMLMKMEYLQYRIL